MIQVEGGKAMSYKDFSKRLSRCGQNFSGVFEKIILEAYLPALPALLTPSKR